MTRGGPPRRPDREPGRATHIDWCDDGGFVGGAEVIPFGILVFVVGVLLITQAWAVIDVKLATDAAAREGVRAFVESPDEATATARADAAARAAFGAHGRDPGSLVVDPPAYGGGRFERCARVTVTVHRAVPAVALPWVGGVGEGLVVTAGHAEVIDPYRSGLDAAGGC